MFSPVRSNIKYTDYYNTDSPDSHATRVSSWHHQEDDEKTADSTLPFPPPYEELDPDINPRCALPPDPCKPSILPKNTFKKAWEADLPTLFDARGFDESRRTFSRSKNIAPITDYKLRLENFKNPLEALIEAVEQIRILKLATKLSVDIGPEFDSQTNSLSSEVQRTIKLLNKALPKDGHISRDLILRQREKIRPDLNVWTRKTEKLKTLVEQKQLQYMFTRDPLEQTLEDLQKQLDLIKTIFSHRILRG